MGAETNRSVSHPVSARPDAVEGATPGPGAEEALPRTRSASAPVFPPAVRPHRRAADPWYVRWALVGATLAIVGILIVIPLVSVFAQATAKGLGVYWDSLAANPDTRHAVFLTLVVAPVAVAMNVVGGIAAAWAIARFRFPGRAVLITLIDLPFSVSPVVAGLLFVLLFGVQAPLGVWLRDHGYQVIFAPPALVLATAFVTFPFVARELIPVLEAVGPEEELAARCLGASGWQLFWRITVPNVKWGLLYGIILSNARAMGEFGAVYVVSGRIEGQTDTMPLRVQKLWEGSNNTAAFALASVLTLLALVTLVLKVLIEPKVRAEATPTVPQSTE
ncbi:sulfate ABC transporter permease subunit CysW [Frigoriglobus tundricola]|uniref:Sulfate transport system permease protein CysW n=1 Tax=Frigoriglobus tundricola TaxID=2774151 RepID=A0A6M5Z545_9BACT|nr:Sulfate transport system permease protein CysW [Frigoriglobus tundricola]